MRLVLKIQTARVGDRVVDRRRLRRSSIISEGAARFKHTQAPGDVRHWGRLRAQASFTTSGTALKQVICTCLLGLVIWLLAIPDLRAWENLKIALDAELDHALIARDLAG